jgi:hypothetical protein
MAIDIGLGKMRGVRPFLGIGCGGKFSKTRLFLASVFASVISISGLAPSLSAALTIVWQGPRDPRAQQLAKLKDFDLVLVVDKSKSMGVADCNSADGDQPSEGAPGMISRWEWCRRQTKQLTEATREAIHEGFKLVVFSADFTEYNDVCPEAIESVFNNNTPSGSTHATRALNAQFEEYFARRNTLGDKTKPLLIVMITDGCPEYPLSVRTALLRASRRMNRADEITVAILKIGRDEEGDKFLEKLNEPVMTDGAKYRIVSTKSFAELEKSGLTGALLDTIASKNTSAHD